MYQKVCQHGFTVDPDSDDECEIECARCNHVCGDHQHEEFVACNYCSCPQFLNTNQYDPEDTWYTKHIAKGDD